jgi:hypothetical protein
LVEYLKQLKNWSNPLVESQTENWTPELRSLTGASAGSINACRDDGNELMRRSDKTTETAISRCREKSY